MRRSSFGGPLGMRELAALTGLPQSPSAPDRATARAAAVELASRGLTVADIAQALHIGEHAVRQLLEVPT